MRGASPAVQRCLVFLAIHGIPFSILLAFLPTILGAVGEPAGVRTRLPVLVVFAWAEAVCATASCLRPWSGKAVDLQLDGIGLQLCQFIGPPHPMCHAGGPRGENVPPRGAGWSHSRHHVQVWVYAHSMYAHKPAV